MFHSILVRKKINILKTGGCWRKSLTEWPANDFSVIITNISCNLELISTRKSLNSSSIIKNLTPDVLFHKAALDLSFKSRNLIPGLIPRPEWMVVPPIFTADIPVVPSKRTLGFSGSLQC